MSMEYWQKQAKESPLFENILWSRPESKNGAGKLLIAGGNSMGFSAVGEAYSAAEDAGAGHIRTLLPDKLRKPVGALLENCEFAASTPSGSFAKAALNEALINSEWADMVLLAGDNGRNSETAVFLEQYTQKYTGPLTITKDAVDYFFGTPKLLLDRPETALVLSLSQLQKMGTAVKHETPFLLGMGMLLLVQALHEFTLRFPTIVVTKELDNILVAHKGKVSSTKLTEDMDKWRAATAAKASVFWMQNTQKPFEAVTSSLVA